MGDWLPLQLALTGAVGWLTIEFGRQLHDAAVHGTIRIGRGKRRLRRDDDPELFARNVTVAIVLFGVFAGAGAWLVAGLFEMI